MFKCTVQYGPDSVEHESNSPIRIGDIRASQDLRDELGYGDNVNLMIGGITMPDDALVPNGSVVVIETAANKKAELELLAA
jgi:hypothetical protein